MASLLAGSKHAKQRLSWFLQTLSGERSVWEACVELGIGESRFFAQRGAWLQEALARSSRGLRVDRPSPSRRLRQARCRRNRINWRMV